MDDYVVRPERYGRYQYSVVDATGKIVGRYKSEWQAQMVAAEYNRLETFWRATREKVEQNST